MPRASSRSTGASPRSAGHAKQLGYDALILFLDELILWLANSIGDQRFVAREIQKITNFVEGGDARRPIPVISFIARQRDLREFVGEEVVGADELGYQDTLNLASGRFDPINLDDRNLPEITRKRLLCGWAVTAGPPTSRSPRLREHPGTPATYGTRFSAPIRQWGRHRAFRPSYPFSPAFLSTLVHVSSALQRSRTALKLMRQLLVGRRETLAWGRSSRSATSTTYSAVAATSPSPRGSRPSSNWPRSSTG